MGFKKETITLGSGIHPVRGQSVKVHCKGWVTSTPKKIFFDSRQPPNHSFSFRVGLGNVIKGWDDGIMTMQPGEKAIITMSSDFGYGVNGFPSWGIPPDAELTFEVELLSVEGSA